MINPSIESTGYIWLDEIKGPIEMPRDPVIWCRRSFYFLLCTYLLIQNS